MSANLDLAFVDTNILIYTHDTTAGEKNKIAVDLINSIWDQENGCLSIQVLQEYYVVATRPAEIALSSEEAAAVIFLLSQWNVHIPTPNDIISAIEVQKRYLVSFWDAMIINSAMQLGCDTLYTEDLNHGQTYGSIKVINPFN